MTRRDLVAVYGRFGVIIAAFALIAGVVAAPILPNPGTSSVVASKPHYEPDLRLPVTPASLKTN